MSFPEAITINRYIGNTGRVIHINDSPPLHDRHTSGMSAPSKRPRPSAAKPANNRPQQEKKPPSGTPVGGFGSDGLGKALKSLLPLGGELSDILILAIFLFLYIESRDTDFLIILIVLAICFYKDSQLLSGLPFLSSLTSLF